MSCFNLRIKIIRYNHILSKFSKLLYPDYFSFGKSKIIATIMHMDTAKYMKNVGAPINGYMITDMILNSQLKL